MSQASRRPGGGRTPSRAILLTVTLASLLVRPEGAGGQAAAVARNGASLSPDPAARVAARLEPEIRRAMLEGSIPSVTVALVDREGTLWAGAYGEANLWARTPATVETVYLIGSTFKTQATVALLRQMERGAFDLDDPVRDHLGGVLTIRGERPDQPVRVRHLLTHTSGLPAAYGGHAVWGETVPPPLETYLRDSLVVDAAPLERVVYSNLAYSLVAWLVQRFSGRDFREHVRETLWAPLGMTGMAFAPTPAMEERLSIPYALDDDDRPVPAVRTKANVWPAGIVYGTILDQAAWLRFALGDGTTPDGDRILEAATLDSMYELQFPRHAGEPGSMAGGWGYESPGYGLTWWTSHRGGERFFAHSGSVSGYTAFLMGNRDRGLGVAFLTNGYRAHPYLVRLSNHALDLLAEEAGRSR